MINRPQTVTIPADIARLLQDVAGYQPNSKLPFQRQFDAALGILLALYATLGPSSADNLRQIVRDADANRGDSQD